LVVATERPPFEERLMSRSSILVTGAAGFIGSWVVRSLCAAGFADVRAGVMSPAGSLRLHGLPVQLVRCDILDRDSLAAAMQGVEIVINCARGRVGSDVTLGGTRMLLTSAAEAGVRRIVQMSSIAVYGEATGIVVEDTAPVPPLNKYAHDKCAAEALCRTAASGHLTIAVIRPSLVYGPFGEEWTARFMRALIAGQLGQLGLAGEGEANLIYAGDLGKFAAYLATADLPPYSVYNANGSEIPTFNEYFDRLSHALGLGPLPPSKERPLGSGIKRHARRLGRLVLREQGTRLRKLATASNLLASSVDWAEDALRPGIHDGAPDQFAGHVTYSIERARLIGFIPSTPLQDGVYASAQWAKSQGMMTV
jgi:2-alkyl-3-oxoalkanoate reductase